MCHVLDTAAVAERVFDKFIGPRCRDELCAAFEPLGSPQAWIATLCGLHDLGKYAPGFQALKVDLALARFGGSASASLRLVQGRAGLGRRVDTPHGLVTAMHLKDLLKSWGASVVAAELLAVALGGHHGYFANAAALRQARLEVNNHGRDMWRAWRDDLVHEVARLRGLADPGTLPWQDVQVDIGAAVGLAALTTISDWIASDTANFPFSDATDLPRYAETADKLASAAVDRLKLRAWAPPSGFAELFPDLAPRPVQTVVEWMTADRSEPTLLLVEAPTGEGKSNAALQAAATLVRNLDLVGTYIAMPTQATSNQMLNELRKLVNSHGSGISVQLIHANAKEYLEELAATPTGVGLDSADGSDIAAQEWFTRKRNLLAPVGVGTVDQALKAAIRSGHVFVRLAALTNKVVVIDEVHAYQTYMSTLLDRLLTWLGRLGVSVVMLSATLPAGRRQDLVAAWQSGLLRCLPEAVPRIEPSTGYPRVTLAGTGKPVVEQAGISDLNTNRTLALTRVADEDIVDWALTQTRAGNSAVVMHNLVRRAVATYTTLDDRIGALPNHQRPRLIMINGQMAAGDRRNAETELRAAFGPKGTRRLAIVVSTQVLEQGLDLDFDAMLTDLAPVDWLIQRAGRLHRHNRDKSRGTPTLAIAGVADSEAGPRFPRYLDRVYAPMTMLRTWALLRDRTTVALPDDVPALVDALYGPSDAVTCPAGWEDAWLAAEKKLVRAQEMAEHNARLMYLPRPIASSSLNDLTAHRKNPSRTRQKQRRS